MDTVKIVPEKGLRCPKCGGKTGVTNTRAIDGGIYRRRRCVACGYRKTSREDFL